MNHKSNMSDEGQSKSIQSLIFPIASLLIGIGGLLIGYLEYAGKVSDQDKIAQSSMLEIYRDELQRLTDQRRAGEALITEFTDLLQLWSSYRVSHDLNSTRALIKRLRDELKLSDTLVMPTDIGEFGRVIALNFNPNELANNIKLFSASLKHLTERRTLLEWRIAESKRAHDAQAYTHYHRAWDDLAKTFTPFLCDQQVKMQSPREIYSYHSYENGTHKTSEGMITIQFKRGHFYGFILESQAGEPQILTSRHYTKSKRIFLPIKPPQSQNVMLGVWSLRSLDDLAQGVTLDTLKVWLAQRRAHPELCVVTLPFITRPITPL